uniref:Putative minor coat protein n=1 Tax=Fig mild mottle-associated virus TaxID=666641 RepID=D3GBB4_9CLOS|nr:putative minor coat protein [Fig mild mottle-associated virus]
MASGTDAQSTSNSSTSLVSAPSNALSSKLVPIENTLQSLNSVLDRLDISSISQTRPDKYTEEEMRHYLDEIKNHMITVYKIDEKDYMIHLTMIIVRLAVVSTSDKRSYSPHDHIKYVVGGTSYKLYDNAIIPYLKNLMHDPDVRNPLRKFCSTAESLLVSIAAIRPDLFETHRATRSGTPMHKGWLSADFVTGSSPLYSELDRSMLLRSREVNLSRTSRDRSGVLVSLLDLGN